jgi:hypothetical protein
MGRSVFQRSWLLWLVGFAAVVFLFIQTQLNPEGSFVGAFNKPNMVTLILVVAVFCALTGAVWLYFLIRDRRAHS